MSGPQFPIGSVAPRTPWHMWGSSAMTQVSNPPGGPLFVQDNTLQLVKVNYKRPETWSFFVAGQIVAGTISDVAREIFVEFTLLIGVGRTIFDTTPFTGVGSTQPWVRFRWAIPAGGRPASQGKKWTTQAPTPNLDDGLPAAPQTMQWFPSEDINCQGRMGQLQAGVSAVQNDVTVEVFAWFAPRTHIRPDWFGDVPDQLAFIGAERGGT